MKKSNIGISLITVFVCVIFLRCADEKSKSNELSEAILSNYFQLTGPIQGTTYSILYEDSLQRNLTVQVDSLLHNYDQYLSMYVDTSVISGMNKGELGAFCTGDINSTESILFDCFDISKKVYQSTNGAFNPAVLPLVKAWGFIDSNSIISDIDYDSLRPLLDFSKVFLKDFKKKNIVDINKGVYQTDFIYEHPDGTQLDFNAIAQGHSVDIVADYLQSLGVINYMIEIGGEVRTKGESPSHQKWKLGIDKPIENSQPGDELQFIAHLSGESLATSGNYRKFYVKDGVKYSHTIDPFTMKPVSHNLLSVTVITDHCAEADAYATAFMVMGVDSSLSFIENNPELNLNAYFISDVKGVYQINQSKGFNSFITKQ